ncbi:MAG TPA: TonB-dependent receptor [Pyrinomonadaceae bacterium]|nr:TonB-dependent receptor [Pyrinomonadaceae bacterium]
MTNIQTDKKSLTNKFSPAGRLTPARKFLLASSCALVALCAQTLFAQATPTATTTTAAIVGRVTDAQGASLAGAIVTLYARAPQLQRLTAVSDAGGAYRFERLAAGEYLIEADASGFAPAVAQKVNVERGQTTMLDLALEVAGVRAEVVVTAADTPQPVDEVSKAITTVGARELDERDEYSIPEALRVVPGLRVQQLGGPGALLSIKMRGLRNQDTAITIDGLRFRDPSSPQGDASGYLSELHATNVSRVEVLRGSGSSLYGTNAVGGVVNIITDEGGAPLRGSLLAEGGGLGLFRGRAQLAGGTSANRVVYSAGISHLNVARGIDGDDATRTTSGQARAAFRLTPTTTLAVRFYAADSFTQLNEDARPVVAALPAGIVRAVPLSRAELRRFEAGTPDFQLTNGAATFIPSTNDPDASRATHFISSALIFNGRPTKNFGYTISYQGNRTDGAFYDGPAGTGFEPFFGTTRTDLDGHADTLNARVDFRLGRANLITAGYEFERERFINRSLLTPPPTFAPSNDYLVDVAERSHTFFIQDQVRLLEDRLQLSAGFRTQRFALSRPNFTPVATSPFAGFDFAAPPNAYTGDGSIAYSFPTTGTKLRAHVGNGYRAPSLFERFGSFLDPVGFASRVPESSPFDDIPRQFATFGDPRLSPERSIAFDAGLDQTFAGTRARASATYFYTRLQEVIAFDFTGLVVRPDPFGRFGGYVNTHGGLARGVELSFEAAPARTLDVRTSYTYTNADERTPRVGSVLRSFTIPDHQFNLTATQRVGRRLLFNFDFTASSYYLAPVFDPSTFGSVVYRFDGIRKADVGANYTLPLSESRSLRFFGYVENLFGREYFENGFRTPGRTGKAGAQFSF